MDLGDGPRRAGRHVQVLGEPERARAMHLSATRSYGALASIGLSTRLHYLVMRRDVTAIWVAPHGDRYRIYLTGLRWDAFTVYLCMLLVVYADLPAASWSSCWARWR